MIKKAVYVLLLLTVNSYLLAVEKHEHKDEPFSLASLLLDGHELHVTLRAQKNIKPASVPSGIEMVSNPQLSVDRAFIEGTARGGSQGRLDGNGMQSAMYARYTDGQADIGFYGLTAETDLIADMREVAIRDIWAHNNSQDRTYVYRKDRVLLVVWIWAKDELPESWSAVQSIVKERMGLAD